MSLKFSMMLQAIDRVTGPAKRIQNSMKGIGRSAKDMARDVGRVGREASQITRLDRASRALAGAIGAAGRAAKHFAGKAGLGSWGDAAELAGYGVGRLARTVGGFALSAVKWAGAAGIGAATLSIYDLLGTASKFEQFQIMLENMEGSATKAKQSLAWVQKFAADTPFELDQVMEAYVRLKSYGIDPLDGSLRDVGDAASGMSKDVMAGVEALADAMTGEYERLKEFGITASTKGNMVALTYRKAGKEFTVQAQKGVAAAKAVSGIWRTLFGGMMQRQSTTFAGLISNLKDKWSGFLLMVAQAGVFDTVKGKLQQLYDWVNKLAEDGTLARWAKQISDWLEKAFNWAVEFVKTTDWKQVGQDLRDLAEAAKAVADAVLLISRNWNVVSSAARDAYMIMNPAGTVASFFTGGPAASPAPARSSPLQPGRGPLRPGASYSTGQGPLKGGAQPVQVGGSVKVELVAPQGWSARTRDMQSNNPKVPLMLQLGRSMGAPQ